MPTVVLDLRAERHTVLSRFGLSMLAGAAAPLVEAGWDPIVVTHHHQRLRAELAVSGTGAIVLPCPEDAGGFVRRSPWLRDLLRDARADLYFTGSQLLDRRCPVPYMFAVHTLAPLRPPSTGDADDAFVGRYGRDELAAVRSELDQLAGWDDPVHSAEPIVSRYLRAITRYLARGAAQIMTFSPAIGRDMPEALHVSPRRVTVMPYTADVRLSHRHDPALVQAVRDGFGLSDGPYFMVVGLTHPAKRVPWLLEHLLAARKSLPTATKIAAVGRRTSPPAGIAEVLNRYGGNDFVTFTGPISDTELSALYRGAAALVSASVATHAHLPLHEAIAYGCPVIATDTPVHREALPKGTALYPPESSERLAALAAHALHGALPHRAGSHHPSDRDPAAKILIEAFTRAVDNGAIPAAAIQAPARSGQIANHLVHHGTAEDTSWQ